MDQPVITVVDLTIDTTRVPELISGYAQMIERDQPDGLMGSQLLRGQDGAWRIQTTWRSFDTLMAVRQSGQPPAALVMLDRLGIAHTHGWFVVEAALDPS